MNAQSLDHPPSTLVDSLAITGMTCASCIGRAHRALISILGIEQVGANLATDHPDTTLRMIVEQQDLLSAIEGPGYSVPTVVTELAIAGGTCTSRVGRAERALMATENMSLAGMKLATERASVQSCTDPQHLIAVVHIVEYKPRLADHSFVVEAEAEGRNDAETAVLKHDTVLAGQPMHGLNTMAFLFRRKAYLRLYYTWEGNCVSPVASHRARTHMTWLTLRSVKSSNTNTSNG